MEVKLLSIRTHISDSGGALSFLEAQRDIPFDIRRVYYIYGEKQGAHRGFHAHKTLRQILFCPYGKIKLILDDGTKRREYLLDNPDKSIVIGSLIWREMIWMQADSVLCVLASEWYDESDYIRDYDMFLETVKRMSH